MTWQGGKLRRDDAKPLAFAPLRALGAQQDDPSRGLEQLTKALGNFAQPVRLHVRLVSGSDGERFEHWDVQGGAKSGRLRKGEPKNADVVVVMRPETWAQIAQGRLAPYEALYAGKLRVGGDFDMAKAIVKHLSDPAMPYVAPC